jgi:hypothetical protein
LAELSNHRLALSRKVMKKTSALKIPCQKAHKLAHLMRKATRTLKPTS